MSLIKIDDIAKLAGYSKATVSKVINNYPGIPESTRQKILKVIKKYEFEPNIQARNLAGKKEKVIGIFIFDKGGLGSYFFQYIIALIIEKAEEKDVKVLISLIKTEKQKVRIKQLIDNGTVQGAIVIGATLNEPELENIIQDEYKLVIFDYKAESNSKNVFFINSNNYEGGKLAAKYLLEKNLKTIYHFTGQENKLPSVQRKEGFLDEIDGNGVICKVLKGEFQLDIAKNIFNQIIKNGEIPEGIFCANDEMAIGCLEALADNGINYKNIKLIGFDNNQISSLYRPRITTIGCNLDKMAEKAVEAILELIEGGSIKKNVYNGELKLYERET
ncbi:LacI family DNA-binding transcriptional regulator [Cetobacterium sp. ZOR0034]|uniref:LacI family DNA-binding transcriptional regulator n=1 Tax=unclassified Cetobacterium TaxID=2630983 RepID=UPI00064693E0|nr:LacI family DNA-binding transcriptional regulator [Cetobacterium sp. ZOR0034]